LDISFAPFPHLQAKSRTNSTASRLFSKEIVLAALCSDHKVRVVQMPLEPPTDETKGGYEPQVIGLIQFQEPAAKVALTFLESSSKPETSSEDVDMETFPAIEEEDGSTQKPVGSAKVVLLVAAASSSGSGNLTFSKVELDYENHQVAWDDEIITPFQAVRLPASAVSISFSPAIYPSSKHSQLLVVHGSGVMRIYNPLLAKISAETPANYPDKGTWLASFSSPLVPTQSDEASFGRVQHKRILDARWVAQGGAVITLLADGEWGLWNIDHSLPHAQGSGGGNPFSLWGNITTSLPKAPNQLIVDKRFKGGRPTFAPMTPNSRRAKEENLFTTPSAPSISSYGGIFVSQVPLPSAAGIEDSIVLWYNDTICTIDSLQLFWSRVSRDSSSGKSSGRAGGLSGSGLTRIDGIDLHNQPISSIGHIPVRSGSLSNLQREFAIITQHELIIYSTVTQRPSDQVDRILQKRRQQQGSTYDLTDRRRLLDHGELGLGDLDAMMDSMEHEDVHMSGALPVNGGSRPMGFTT
jgi:hypothetical protein